jgi:hypothetical protein
MAVVYPEETTVVKPSRQQRVVGSLPPDRGRRGSGVGGDCGYKLPANLPLSPPAVRLWARLVVKGTSACTSEGNFVSTLRLIDNRGHSFVTVQGVAREGDRGRSTISSFLKHFRRLPHHPHVRASADRWNFSCYSSRLLVYSRCSFPIAPTLTDVALP